MTTETDRATNTVTSFKILSRLRSFSSRVPPAIKFALDSYVITSSIILSFCEFVGIVDMNSFSSESYHQVGIFLSSSSQTFQSTFGHPRTGYVNTLFAPITLTLTRWPWYTNLTWRFRWCTCIWKWTF